jgi:DNA-binding CsgD family transcriptional regulator
VLDRLTAKELRIVALVVQGYKNKEIAAELGTTEQVIKNYLRNLYDKIGVSPRNLSVLRYNLVRSSLLPSDVGFPFYAKLFCGSRSDPWDPQRNASSFSGTRPDASTGTMRCQQSHACAYFRSCAEGVWPPSGWEW